MSGLKDKTIKSVFWFSIEKFGTQIIQLIISILLARILSPSDYGIVGMVLVFLTISSVIIESGFSQAIIRKENADEKDYNTVFLFNITIAVLLYTILFFSSPFIADFYRTPELDLLTKVISLNLILISFSIVQGTILVKRIDFKTQTKIALTSIIISSIAALIFAFLGFRYWALVIQVLVMNFVRTVLLWFRIKWKPAFRFHSKSFYELFGFGSKLFFASIIETIYQNIYSLIIGKLFNSTILGYYSQARKIQETPTANLAQIIQKVTYPVYATIQTDDARLKRGYRKSIILIMFVNAPIMFGLLTVSDSFIEIFLTHKWIEAAVFLKLLCIMGVIFPLHSINLNILKVKGRSDLYLRLQIIKNIVGVIFIIISLYWGIMGLIIGQIISMYVAYYINAYYSGKLIDYSFIEQIKDIFPYIFISLVSFCIVYPALYFSANYYLLFFAQTVIGFGTYLLLAKLFNIEGFIEFMNISRLYLSKLKIKN